MAWQRRWWVHVWTGGLGVGSMAEDAEGVRQVHVDNVAALREVITGLRTDPNVRRWTFGPFDELDKTDAPTHCRCGRELDGPRTYAAKYRWRCASTAPAMSSTAAGCTGAVPSRRSPTRPSTTTATRNCSARP